MKKTLTLIAVTLLTACGNNAPTVDELLKDKELYAKVSKQCKNGELKRDSATCQNYHTAADKKKTSDLEFPEFK